MGTLRSFDQFGNFLSSYYVSSDIVDGDPLNTHINDVQLMLFLRVRVRGLLLVICIAIPLWVSM